MIEIGKINTLKVARASEQGFYLIGDDPQKSVLLPNKYIPEGLQIGDNIDVFIYKDSSDLIIATTLKPKINLHGFACLKVVDVSKVGVFLDWGLEKDLMVPFSEQKSRMRKGEYYLVYLYIDGESERLAASCKVDHFLERENLTVQVGDEVELLIGDSSDVGVNVIINDLHKGLLFHNEVYKDINPGMRVKGYIKNIREDKKIDVSLQKQGFANIEDTAQQVLDALTNNEGFLNLNDNSHPDEIADRLQMSKKSFKKAIGTLYKQKRILITDTGIQLV
jgi:predicted RNA-binding protein (virulence factor B family)